MGSERLDKINEVQTLGTDKLVAVGVTFWNIDWEYEWTRDFIIEHEPSKEWLRSLYDGVNEAIDFEILGEVVKRK